MALIWRMILVLCLGSFLVACRSTPAPETATASQPPTAKPLGATSTATATLGAPPALTPTVPAPDIATVTPSPTPTAEPVALPATPTPPVTNRCQGLGGMLEVQVLVGPAEAVGLEPVAVGQVPIAVTTQQPPYRVEGQAPISYEATLTEEWGTYSVNLDLEMAVSGECRGEAGSELLDLVLDMSGEQFVVVDAEGFHGEYPWSGSRTLHLSFPLQEGATAEGEGWMVVLHLGGLQ